MILDLDILVKDLDLVLFFILDIKTEKIIEKCVEKCVETANYYTTPGFSGNLIFAIIARMLCGNHLNLSLEELKNVTIIVYSNTRTVQIAEFLEISHFLN